MIVEFSQFNLDEDVDEEEFLKAAEKVRKDFLEKQPGFISRELLRSEEDWFDIVHWKSEAEAEAAGEKFNDDPACEDFAEMIDEESFIVLYLEEARKF